ncbi:CehA/McbA family metallohydrolase [Jiangella muralis]|uniref:CehA/McbA family metallohydrolase n=1 Tax=Jiangella muralis TaxID=702383 RepID=UPI00069E4A10|nr:CehA/McbA family metallohydrolase [Jiangella muralis]
MDYQPVDLTSQANADDDVELPYAAAWRGEVLARGLPFRAPEDGGRPRVVRLEPGETRTVALETAARVRTVTFAHRTRGDASPGFTALNRVSAVYRFGFSDGESVRVPIRDGFETDLPSLGWGMQPSLAVPDEQDGRPDRDVGHFADAGAQLTGVVAGGRWSDRPGGPSFRLQGVETRPRWFLWSWTNPRPEHDVVRIDLEPAEAVVEVGGICLGFVDEHPLLPEPARAVTAEVPPGYTGDGSDLEITVDRGTVTYTTPLLRQPAAGDPLAAWGDAPDAEVTAVYARVSSTGSGTLRLEANGETIEQARWAELAGRASGRPGSLRVTELGRNWVRTTIVDDATGEPVACRVNFTSPDGVPYQPHGHHHHVNGDRSSWHLDVGADVRLGRTTYAYTDGRCEGWLPRGDVRVRVAKGFEYEPVDRLVRVGDDTRELTLRVERVHDLGKDRWYSGDTHVHFVSSFGGLKEAAAEGVSVVHLLQSQWGNLFTNTEDFIGRPVTSDDGQTVLYTSQENRQHFLGHLSLLGLTEPVLPWSTDGPEEAELGGGLDTTLSDWADRCHAQGGTVVVPHFPLPLGEQAAMIATDRVDSVESLGLWSELMFLHYYRYLNAGYRLPVNGGTDKMTNEVPIGMSRTYVRLGNDDDFGYDAWHRALRAGRSYMSSGPLLSLSVDGRGIGDTVGLPEKGGTVSVRATARGIFPMCRLELVHNGRVIASSENDAGVHDLSLDENVRCDRPGWLAVRVGGSGPEHLTLHRDVWRRSIMAHTSPVYVACGERTVTDRRALEDILTLIERGRSYVEHRAAAAAAEAAMHHHGGDHRAFLVKPFDQARAAVQARLRLAES